MGADFPGHVTPRLGFLHVSPHPESGERAAVTTAAALIDHPFQYPAFLLASLHNPPAWPAWPSWAEGSAALLAAGLRALLAGCA